MRYPYARKPRPGQLRAMKRAYKYKRQAVFGPPGTGKTKVALDFIGVLLKNKIIKRVLVLAPLTAIVGVWEEQIEIDCPWLRYSIWRRKQEPDWNSQALLINYDLFIPRRKKKRSKRTGKIIPDKFFRDHAILNKLIEWEPDVIIFDESHKIKNPYSKRSKAAHKLARTGTYVLCLTGSPQGNKKVLDLWSQFEALQPGLLDQTYDEFKNHYCIWTGFGGHELLKFKNIKHLAHLIAPFVTRLKEEELPKQNDIPIRIDMTPRAKQIYRQMEKEFLTDVSEEFKKLKRSKKPVSKMVATPIVLSKMLKLSQISGGFIRDEEGNDIPLHTCKLEALKEIMDDLKESKIKRVVIYARFKWELKKIREWLGDWVTYTIDGDTPIEMRRMAIEMYNNSGGVVICQTATGSESLNLQAGNYEIDYSTDYSYINYFQRRKRIHRSGQKKPCYFYQLKCKGTIDVDLYRLFADNESADKEFMKLIDMVKERNA